MRLTAAMRRKENFIKDEPCVIKKVVTLPDAEYEKFSNNLIAEQDFIKRNVVHMGFDNGERHCLLVTSDSRQDGILVDSSGYGYARYAAHVPNAKDLLLIQYMTPEMRELLEKLPVIVEDIVARRIDDRDELEIDLSAIETKYNYTFSDSMMALGALHNALVQHSDISEVYIDIGAPTTVSFNPPTQKMEMTL